MRMMRAGLRNVRNPCMYVARMAIFDRANNRFLGNILGVRPENVGDKDRSWTFNPRVRACMHILCVVLPEQMPSQRPACGHALSASCIPVPGSTAWDIAGMASKVLHCLHMLQRAAPPGMLRAVRRTVWW